MIAEAPAPWFFKQRFALFGGVYGLSFFGGFAIAGLLGIATRPLFLSTAHPLALALVAVSGVLGGYALRVWASSYIAAQIVWTQDVQLGELTVSGPYRFTRNPLYLGNLLQAIGIGMLGPWPVFALLTLLTTAYCFVLISVEEPYLARKNGAAYEAYRARVPRFFPMSGRVAPDGRRHGACVRVLSRAHDGTRYARHPHPISSINCTAEACEREAGSESHRVRIDSVFERD